MGVNPYAAPAVDDAPSRDATVNGDAPACAARLLVLGHLLLVVLGLFLGGAAGLAMRLALWHPEGTSDVEHYGLLVSVHGSAMVYAVMMPAVFGVLGGLVVPEAMRARRIPLPMAGWVGLVLWSTGAVVLVIFAMTAGPWTFFQPSTPTPLLVGPLLVATGSLLVLVQLGSTAMAGFRSASTAGRIVTAAILLPLAWQCVRFFVVLALHLSDPMSLAVTPFLEVLTGSLSVLLIATLGALTHIATRRHPPGSTATIASAVALVLVGIWLAFSSYWPIALLGFGAKLPLIALWLRAIARNPAWRGAVALLVGLGIVPALLVYSASVSLLARLSVDIHLHDTYFVVGQLHLAAAVVVLTMIAGLLTWSEPLFGRRPRTWPARLGAVLLGASVVAQAILMLLLGGRGMPRRYSSYVPQFTELQRGLSIAAFAALAGGVLLLVAWIAGRRSTPAGGGPALLG